MTKIKWLDSRKTFIKDKDGVYTVNYHPIKGYNALRHITTDWESDRIKATFIEDVLAYNIPNDTYACSIDHKILIKSKEIVNSEDYTICNHLHILEQYLTNVVGRTYLERFYLFTGSDHMTKDIQDRRNLLAKNWLRDELKIGESYLHSHLNSSDGEYKFKTEVPIKIFFLCRLIYNRNKEREVYR